MFGAYPFGGPYFGQAPSVVLEAPIGLASTTVMGSSVVLRRVPASAVTAVTIPGSSITTITIPGSVE